MKLNKAIYISLPVIGLLAAGCASDIDMPGGPDREVTLKLNSPQFGAGPDASEGMDIPTNVYVFNNGILKESHVVNPGEAPDFNVYSDNKVYAVAGVSMPSLPAGSSEEKLTEVKVSSPSGAQSAPVFFSGEGILNETADGMEVTLRYGVARLDVACADPKISVREILVEDAPASSYVLPPSGNSAASGETVTYKLTVGSDFDGSLQQAFTLYESSTPVSVRVKGTYDGDPMNFVTSIPLVERNKIYTLSISGGSELQSAITIADWAEGDSGDGIIILGETAIDMENSVIPAGVTIDKVDNTILFPPTGVKDMRLAFRTSAPLSIKRSLGEIEKISVVRAESKEAGNGYITVFNVNVPAQPKCARSYDATFLLEGAVDFFLNMKMQASPYQIPTVRMAGREWMCFNALSNDVENQIYLPDNLSVDQMYNEHFEECVGNYFQYGRVLEYSPWTANNPTGNDAVTRNIPWQTVGLMPLPPGFHVASAAEWKALCPPDGQVPAKYTSAGDSIHATVVTLEGTLQTPSTNINNQNYKKRYVLFESITTGNKLYIPFIGIKEAKAVELPTQGGFRFETRSGYWVKEDRYFWLMDFKDRGEGVEGATMAQNRWNYNGFMGVRGVKD